MPAPTKPAPVYESSAHMAQRLRDIAEQHRPEAMPYRNDKRAEAMLARKERLGVAASVQLDFELARELMRAGRSEEAIALFDAVNERLARSGPVPADVRRELDRLKAVTWLRLGEQENCVDGHNVDSCLLPIRGGGIHAIPRGSRQAAAVYRNLLEREPDDLGFRWLLNLAHMTLGEYPDGVPQRWRLPPAIFASDTQVPRYYDVAMATGVAHNALSGGAVLEDFSGDGLVDIVTTSWGVADPMRYFENDGTGGFVDRTAEAGLAGQLGGLNVVQADYDNDGWTDFLVLRGAWLGSRGQHPNTLLRNLGDGSFRDVTVEAGLLDFQPSPSAAWGDFNNDGHLDLFVANESRSKTRYCRLYRNNGDGTFTDVAEDTGVRHAGFVKGAVWGDIDNDGRLDLYLSRLGQPNVLYRNDGPGANGAWRFSDISRQAGVTRPSKSFPTWFFDYDNDGWLDLMVASFADFHESALRAVVADYLGQPADAARTLLYRNRGDGSFDDVSEQVGVDRVLLAMGANFGDIDNDGWLDAYFGTGEPSFSTLVPNVLFRNRDGERFEDVTTAGGFGNIQKGHGIAFGDVDNDGDQDIYANMGGAYSGDFYPNLLFENPGNDHSWVTLRLEGVRSNRSAIGARVRVDVVDGAGNERSFHRVVGTGGSFGASTLQQEIGLGTARSVSRLTVHWPASGQTDVHADVPINRVLRVVEGEPDVAVISAPAFRLHGSGGSGDRQHQH